MTTPKRSRPGAVRGVAVLSIAMLIGATGCVGPSPLAPRDDVAITEAVRARLAANEQTKPFPITVGTTDGVVHVSGSVEKSADRDSVERVARETPGVRSVDNDVRFGDLPVTP
jgi:hyperosmotically inducible periplasmic protein